VSPKASDLTKTLFVLEFLNLDEKPGYSETEIFETEIITSCKAFLLELGKGFYSKAGKPGFHLRRRPTTTWISCSNNPYCVAMCCWT